MFRSTQHSLTVLAIILSLAYPAASNGQPFELNASEPQLPGSLIAFYDFDEGTGEIVHDTSEYGEPLDLTIEEAAAIRWLDGSLEVTSSAVISSLIAANKVTAAILASREMTVEAWVTPALSGQFGPARIVALSKNEYPDGSNFVLGQSGRRYTVRFRTSDTNVYGNDPELQGPEAVTIEPTHVVFTRDTSGETRLYTNGVLVNTANPGASLDNWDVSHTLTLANEPTGERSWLGTLHLVAIYDFALSPGEVEQSFDAGDSAPGCLSDSDCDDSLFCNGSETCNSATGSCTVGVAACIDALHCDEAGDTCKACVDDAECDDGSFCNGAETCDPNIGRCIQSEAICGDAAHCDEIDDTCFNCVVDADCSDASFCNGEEQCVAGLCNAGVAACIDALHCDEVSDTCAGCVSDTECDDGVGCTTDTCVAGSCNIANGCNSGDTCDAEQDLCVSPEQRARLGLLVLYTFDEGEGDVVRDHSEFGAPLDLLIEDTTAAKWLAGSLELTSSAVITSSGPARKVTDAIMWTGEVTVEAWTTTTKSRQWGPARIVTLSENPFPDGSNFMLGQQSDGYTVRLRTTNTNQFGNDPALEGPPMEPELTHVVFTRGVLGQTKLYVNGVLVNTGNPGTSLASWDVAHVLALGNESTGDRPWLGTLHLVAIYDRVLVDTEVAQNFAAGPGADDLLECLASADCDDGNFCNGAETCNGETRQCVAGAGTCIDAAHCIEETDTCIGCASDSECADGNFCNGAETCDTATGECQNAPDACIDLAHCDETGDVCLTCIDDTDCNDGSFCNGAETCDTATGECQNAADECTDLAHCNETNDVCLTCVDDAECDDSLSCTVDSCVANACQNATSCESGETCDSILGECTVTPSTPFEPSGLTVTPVSRNQLDLSWIDNSDNEEKFELERAVAQLAPIPFLNPEVIGPFETLAANIAADVTTFVDDTVSGGTGYCYRIRAVNAAGASTFSEMACNRTPECTVDSECDDADFCNGLETCNVGIGLCTFGDEPCVDSEHCDEVADVCLGCIADVECDDGNFCNGEETCNVVTAECTPGTTSCEDEAHCDETVDSCLECIADDECADGVFCNGAEICDTISGQCSTGTPLCIDAAHCDEDNDICTGCTTDSECTDGAFCNGAETCDIATGECQASPAACTDMAHCDETGDVCLECVADAECDDTIFCNGVEQCDAGACAAGVAACLTLNHCNEFADNCIECFNDAECDDGAGCSTDTCMAGFFCENVSICDGGQVCDVDLDQCVEPLDPPAAPSGVIATAEAPDRIAVSWDDNSDNEASFELQRAEVFISPIPFLNPFVLGPFETIAVDIVPDTTNFIDATVSPGTGYCYRVRAINETAASEYSFWDCDTTPF